MSTNNNIFGACVFCGQIATGNNEEFTCKEQADKEATMNCSCSDARELQKKEKQKKNAKANIRKLFRFENENFESVQDESLIQMMYTAVDNISEDKLDSVTLSIPGIGTARISANAKRGIVVERKKTFSKKITADK